jgi:hypothetical protein
LPKTQVREASNLPQVPSLTKTGFVATGNSHATAARDSDKRQRAPSLFPNRPALGKDPQLIMLQKSSYKGASITWSHLSAPLLQSKVVEVKLYLPSRLRQLYLTGNNHLRIILDT